MMSNDQTKPRVFAIVPAAGQSRRMGSAKQLLDFGGRPMLFAVLEPLTAADVAGVALVTNLSIVEQIEAIDTGDHWLPMWVGESEKETFIVYNDDLSSEMIDSVRIALSAWNVRVSVKPKDGFLVCPADHPGISASDFNRCIQAFIENPDRIVIATRDGRRGHPIILPAEMTTLIKSPACDAGLNIVPHAYPDRVLQIATASDGVTRDVDTPDDYESLS